MTCDLILNKVLDKIKKITGIEQFYNAKILIDKHDKLFDDVNFKILLY